MKIIVELLHGLGDTVCALPMLKVLRDNYPQASITVLVKGMENAEIIRASIIRIDEFIILNIYKNNLFKNLATILELRKKKFGFGISCAITPVIKAKVFMNLIDSKKNIGIQHELNKSFDDLEDVHHFTEAGLLAIKSICILPTDVPKPYLKAAVTDTIFVREKMRIFNNEDKIIGICIGNADFKYRYRLFGKEKVFTKGWGIKNMDLLVQKLLEKNFNIVLIGGKLEATLVNMLSKSILSNSKLLNLIAETDMRQSIAVVQECDLVIGVDTGMQHIAAATGTKTLSIHGPTNPLTRGAYSKDAEFIESKCDCKYCYGTKKNLYCDNRKCLNMIKVDDVVEQVIKIISR